MRRQGWWLPMLAVVFMTNWKSTLTLPVPDEELDTSTKLLGSSVVTSVSVVTGSSENEVPISSISSSTADRRRVIPSKDLPGSPAGLLRPDRFQFYTFNKDGNVVTKQMTEKEIQGLIAAGGGHLPIEIHESQNTGDAPVGGMKVADVVQNVQNVLKGELSKPTTVMTSVPTIPGHVNTEWSSILPSILGGDSETAPVSDPDIVNTSIVADTMHVKKPASPTATTLIPPKRPSGPFDFDTKKKPTEMPETDIHSEKPMIQVPVITVDQKLPGHQAEEDSMPVFQMLNTISADKVKSKNGNKTSTASKPIEPPKTVFGHVESAAKPEIVSTKPTAEAPVTDKSKPVEEILPEMVEITFNSGNIETEMKKPIGELPMKTSETVSKTPESESTMSVVSETHTTSMKISGHEEIPLRETAKPTLEQKPEKMTEKTTDEKMDTTTVRAKVTTEQAAIEAPAKPGFFAQGVSFFGNLPETVSSIVSDLISNNAPNAEESSVKIPSKNSEKESVGATNLLKKPEIIVTPTKETNAGTQKEPVYQIIPEIAPNKKMPPHGASPSEASSIEHIIETLNDPTGSISGTVAADHFVVHTLADENASKADVNPGSEQPTNLPDVKGSTSATPIGVETSAESNSTEPVEPLPTELADSLSSMISQISDAMPSVLPVSPQAGLDTTEKKNGMAMNAEDPNATENVMENTSTELPIVSEAPEESTILIQSSTEAEPAKTTVLDTKESEIKVTTVVASASTEKLKENPTTTDIPITTESSNLDSSVTLKNELSSMNTESVEVSATKADPPVTEKIDVSSSKPEKVKPEADEVPASSDITTDKITPEVKPIELPKIEVSTKPEHTEEVAMEVTKTEQPATTIATPTTIVNDQTEEPTLIKVESVIAQEIPKPEDSKVDTTTKHNDNDNTEAPIVRIDITEAKPTEFKITNNSQGISTNLDDGTESPLVRIQLMANPVTLINNMIESAVVETSPPPVEPLVLPKTGSVPPNEIASGLIAGFPSTTTQASTKNVPTTPEVAPIAVESVKFEPEVQVMNDAPAMSVDTKTTNAQVDDTTPIPVTPVFVKETATEKIENSESSTLKNDLTGELVPVTITDLPKEPIAAESTEKATTVQLDSMLVLSNDKPKNEQKITYVATTKTPEVEASTPQPENVKPSIKVTEKIPSAVEETTSKTSAAEAEAPENRIHLPASSIPDQPEMEDKVNEASKIVETSVSTSVKPETPATPNESTETTIKDTTLATNSEKSAESNATKTESPVVRIETAPEKLAEAIPPRIQLTDLPIIEPTSSPKEPVKDDSTQTFLTTAITPSVTTMQSPVESTENNRQTSTNVSLQADTLSSENDTTAKPETITKKSEKTDMSADPSNSSEKVTATQKTEEVRIQVNDTAVRVTKRPIAEVPNKKLDSVEKTADNQELSTTPKIAIVAEDSSNKSGEKTERLPEPGKLTETTKSPANNNVAAADPVIKKIVSGSETETRIRLGDEQGIKDVAVPTKLDDPRKPIKKNNDAAQPSVEKESSIVSKPNDKKSANSDKDSKTETSTKMEITTSVTMEETSTPKIIVTPSKSEEKQSSTEKDTLIKVTSKPIVKPTAKPAKPAHKPTMNIKKDDAIVKPADEKWTLIPQQVYPTLSKTGSHGKKPSKPEVQSTTIEEEQKIVSTERPPVSLDHPQSASGLDSTVRNLETDISYFANLCNELAFSFWTSTNKGLSTARSLAVSPFGMTSMLAMVFLGARGPTSDQMNDILRLDDVASFNPHLVFQNVTDAVGLARNQGIANAAFVRELFADRSKVRKLMPFYKDQAQQFYDGIVAEVNFATISDLVRRRTNLMIRKQTGGRIKDFVRTNTVPLRSPLAALSANVFQTDCNSSAASSEGRDGELYFAVSPAVRQRKLVPVPATVWRAGVLAGYEPSIDATAIALGGADKLVSTIFVMPGQQGHTAPGDTLERLEQRVVKGAAHEGAWNKLLKVLIPRPGLELQVPKFSHRSVINATAALKRMGLEELFSKHADLKGINGVATDLHLADVLQMNLFSTCGDENIISGRHHVEVYPGSPLRNARDYHESVDETDAFADDLDNEQEIFKGSATLNEDLLHREKRMPRQTDGTEKPRLKLDRPFLYFVRHNPTGLILHMGRFNPRLLP